MLERPDILSGQKATSFQDWYLATKFEIPQPINLMNVLCEFLSQPFEPRMITEYFGIEGHNEYDNTVISYDFTKFEIWVIDDSDMWFMRHEFEDRLDIPAYPSTLDNFISDCQRAAIQLTWK